MEKYEVFYKDALIGKLFVNDDYKYCYEPNFDEVEKIKKSVPLIRVMEEGTNGEFGEPIPFFQERLRYMKLWQLSVIGYHTDYFTIKRIMEE